MFCLGCGSEIPLRSEYCPVCGQRIGPQGGVAPTPKPKEPPFAVLPSPDVADASYTPDAPEPSPPTETGMASETAPRISALPGHAPRGSGAIGLGDLEGFAFPRDTPGRVTLGAAVAIIVSVFLPWATLVSYTLVLIQVTAPAVTLIGVALVAAFPAFWAPTRRRLPTAALPFGLGACLLGMGILLLMFVGPFASNIISQVILAMTGNSAPAGTQIPVSADMGLYLFLFATAALTISGYFVLIEAILATAPRAQPMPAPAIVRPAAPAYPTPQEQAALSSSPSLMAGMPGAIPFAQPAQSAQPAAPRAPETAAPPRPGDLRWEQQIASPPVVRRPAAGGRPGSVRGPHR